MYTNHFANTTLPVNKPYFRGDLRQGEDAIVNAAIFREHGLQLYANVPAEDLHHGEDRMLLPSQQPGSCLDYLICRGDEVVLAVELSDRDGLKLPRRRIPHLLYAVSSALEMEQGEVGIVLEKLEDLLCARFLSCWTCSLQPLREEWTDQLLNARLLELREGQSLPTEYGSDFGLVTAIDEKGRSVRYSSRVEAKLAQQLYTQAEFENGQFVRQLAQLPLEEYMADAEPVNQRVRALLPSCKTYGQAAEAAHRLLQQDTKKGTLLMQALALPLYQQAMARRQACDELLEDGMVQFAQEGADLPEDERRSATRNEFDRRRAEWNRQMETLRQEDPFRWKFLTISMKGFFDGVAFCTQLDYPRWLAKTLTVYYADTLDEFNNYTEALCDAYETVSSAALDQQEGVRLLYQLTIEPFHLIYQKCRELERFHGDAKESEVRSHD